MLYTSITMYYSYRILRKIYQNLSLPMSQARWVTLAWTWKGTSPESGVLIEELNGERSRNADKMRKPHCDNFPVSSRFPWDTGCIWSMQLLVQQKYLSSPTFSNQFLGFSTSSYGSSGCWASCWFEVLQRAVLLAAAGPAAHSTWAWQTSFQTFCLGEICVVSLVIYNHNQSHDMISARGSTHSLPNFIHQSPTPTIHITKKMKIYKISCSQKIIPQFQK